MGGVGRDRGGVKGTGAVSLETILGLSSGCPCSLPRHFTGAPGAARKGAGRSGSENLTPGVGVQLQGQGDF